MKIRCAVPRQISHGSVRYVTFMEPDTSMADLGIFWTFIIFVDRGERGLPCQISWRLIHGVAAEGQDTAIFSCESKLLVYCSTPNFTFIGI